ncbi:FlgT C-terminal domain-containing protein, partial [Staphylococcus pseudintermedius]
MEKKFGVAAILDEYTIIINAGKSDDVSEGDSLSILSDSTIEIKDPFTDEVLYELKRIKAKLKIVRVFEKVSFCKSKNEKKNIFSNIGFDSNNPQKLR